MALPARGFLNLFCKLTKSRQATRTELPPSEYKQNLDNYSLDLPLQAAL